MVLATRYKSINKLVKFLAVLLSVVLMCGTALCAVRLVASLEYTGNVKSLFDYETKDGLAECDPLVSALVDDIERIGLATYYSDEESIKKELLSQKEDFISSILERFKKQQAEYYNTTAAEDVYDEDEDGETTTLQTDVELLEPFDFSYTFSLPGGMEAVFSSGDFYETDDFQYHIDYVADDESSAKQKLENMFNYFVENKGYVVDYDAVTFEAYLKSDLCYYVKNRNNGIVISNITEQEAQQALQKKYGFTYVNHQVKTTKELSGVFDRYYSAKEQQWELDDNDCDYYFYFNTDMSKTEAGRNSYIRIISDYKKVNGYKVDHNLIGGIVMIILSVALAVWYFVNAGIRDENGKIKLAFIDRVPSDLHIAVSVGLIVLGLWGLVQTFDGVGYLVFSYDLEQRLMLYLGLGAVAVIWLLFIEMVSSFIRVCKSEKPLYKNLLMFWCGKYFIYVPCLWLFRKAKQLFKKFIKLFTYKPNNFKRILTRYLILYLGVNFLIFLIMGLAAGDGDYPGVIFGAGFIALLYNTAIIAYGVWYAVQLDRIITAAHNRTEPQVNLEKLPQSLKILADSIRVSRDELSVAISKAVRDERMRAELITNVSHDLKTPLTSIISYVDLLKGCEIENDDAKEYIGVLDEKSGRLKRLIDDLIEASKITSGVISINPVQLSLSELAAQAVYERQQEFLDNNLELVFKGDKTNVSCFADGNKAFRVFDNLLSNAKKYSARGTRVYCDVYSENGMSVFELKNISAAPLDISPEELTERFVRGDKSRTQDGNGLGLSIASSLCEAMNGRLIISIDGDLFKAKVFLPKE